MRSTFYPILLMLLAAAQWGRLAVAQTVIYDDALAPGWTSWSWDGEYSFDHTDEVLAGAHSVSATASQFGALSLHSDRPFPDAAGVTFWLRGDGDSLVVFLHADGEETIESAQFTVADQVESTADEWVLVSVDIEELGQGDWTRISIMNVRPGEASFLVDEIVLLGVDFPAAEPPADDAGEEETRPDAGDDVVEDLSVPDGDPTEPPSESTGWCRIASPRTGRPGWQGGLLLALVLAGWRRCRKQPGRTTS